MKSHHELHFSYCGIRGKNTCCRKIVSWVTLTGPYHMTFALHYMWKTFYIIFFLHTEIGDIAGVADVTIRQSYRLIYPRAADLFPPDFKFDTPVDKLPQLWNTPACTHSVLSILFFFFFVFEKVLLLHPFGYFWDLTHSSYRRHIPRFNANRAQTVLNTVFHLCVYITVHKSWEFNWWTHLNRFHTVNIFFCRIRASYFV